VIAKPALLFLEGVCDRIIKVLWAAGFDQLKPALLGVQRAEQVGCRNLTAPADRATKDGALRCIARRGEEFRMLERILYAADIGVSVGDEFGYPPAFDSSLRKDFRRQDQPAFLDRTVEFCADGIDPELRSDIR